MSQEEILQKVCSIVSEQLSVESGEVKSDSNFQNDLGAELTQDFLDKITWTLSATYLNNTPLYGLEPFQAAMSGDQSAWQRMTANLVRGAIPMSGALGVVSNAITASQKDIYKDLMGYIGNRVPIASSFLPEKIDYWTGQPINEIDNPFLRTLNALSPIKVLTLPKIPGL